MRSAARITSTPREFRRAERQERDRLTRELHRELARARASDAAWYVWIRDEWAARRRAVIA